MNRIFLFFALFLTSFVAFSQGFIKNYGGNATDIGSAAVQTPDGGFAIGSISESFGVKTFDMLLTRVDFEGKLLWNKTYGGNFKDQCFDIAAANDGGFVLAGYSDIEGGTVPNNQFYVVKTDIDGNEIWSRKFGNANDDKVASIIVSKSGNYIGVGSTFNGTDYDAYIFVLDNKGQTVWTYATGGVGNQDARDVVEVSDGYVFTGTTQTKDATGQLDKNVLMVKVSKSGVPVWFKTYGSADLDEGNAIAITQDNGFIIAGRTKKNIDILALRIDTDGNEIWTKSFGGAFEDEAYSVVANQDGSFTIAGNQATNAVNIDAYLLKIDKDGTKIWSQNIGQSPRYEAFNNIIATSDGGYFATGLSGDLTNDIYCVKTNGNGVAASGILKGKVFFDKIANCKYDNGETTLGDWLISVTSKKQNYVAYSKANGDFSVAVDTGKYEVNLLLQNSYWKKVCQTSFTAIIDQATDTVNVDFPVRAAVSCPNMEVNISVPKLTRCASNTYSVSFCNRGTENADNAYVILEFDEFFEDIQVNLANVQALGNNKFRCNLNTIPPGICGKFTVLATLDKNCNSTVLGQTHTVSAHIYPDSICASPNANWDGSSIEVSGKCQNNQAIFTVKNVGKSTSTPKNGLVIEDDIIYKTQKIPTLLPNASQDYIFDAKGKTYRMIVEQAAGHPGSSYPTVAIEGCGAVGGTFSTGYVLQFNEDDGNPFVSVCKQESVGAANKNDKTGFPKGFKADRFVSDSSVIDYQISFKNTYGKTIEKVTVIDTLSSFLNPMSIYEILSSHNYVLTFPSPNVLQFTFDKINLPDSAANVLAANGFVKFKILQRSDKPDNAIIYNRAAIHFDGNATIATNRIKHTVKKNFTNFIQTLTTQNIEYQHVSIKIYPNPFAEITTIALEGENFETLNFELFDLLGQKVRSEKFENNEFNFARNGLSAGVYLFRINQNNKTVKVGKIVIQ